MADMTTDWSSWRPVLTALAMPPLPCLLLVLVGARLILPRRGRGYLLVLLGVLGAWFSSTQVGAVWLQHTVLQPGPSLYGDGQTRLAQMGQAHLQQVRRSSRAGPQPAPPAAIIVLGGGRDPLAPEYGASDLSDRSLARLRYGIWLSKQTKLPLGFSGGVGWGQKSDGGAPTEAEVAARLAEQQFGVRLQWTEARSSDTRGNAALTLAMLGEQGVPEVVLVTDAVHMPRAKRAFNEAARALLVQHPEWPLIRVTPAPTGFWRRSERPGLDWLPSAEGSARFTQAWRECLGWWLQA